MRILIDMQGAQTASRYRGIGRYTLSLAQAIARNRGEDEIVLALNGLFPETIEPIRATFDGLLSQDNIKVWQAPGPVNELHAGNDDRRAMAELVREAFIAAQKPDVVHITSMFEGYEDDAVTSIGRFDRQSLVSVSLYDLIPLGNPSHYLRGKGRFADYYYRRLRYLEQASLLLTISEFSKAEGAEHLQLPLDRFVNVSAAVEPVFRPLPGDAVAQTRRELKLTRPFILYTGGGDERKNLPRLIQAFAILPSPLRATYQLIVAGKLGDQIVAELRAVATASGIAPDAIRFIGYVTDRQLVDLYNLCTLFVFPSWHEGFGLPALEAMACGAPVIGAGTTSVPEVIGLEEALFDPMDVAAVAAKMTEVLDDTHRQAALRAHGLERARLFSWDVSARRALEAWRQAANGARSEATAGHSWRGGAGVRHRRKLAFVTPLPPERSGVADYSALVLPALAAHYDIDVVVAPDGVNDAEAGRYGRVQAADWLYRYGGRMDRVLYQMGNSPFHAFMLPLLKSVPGAVVLHDFYLGGLMGWLELDAGVTDSWTRELYLAHGYKAVRERFRDASGVRQRYPTNASVLQHAQGVMVHSLHAKKLMAAWYGEFNPYGVRTIPLVRSPAAPVGRIVARQQLGLSPDDFVVCSFGFVGESKLNHRLLDAWIGSSLGGDAGCRLLFVGENHGGEYGGRLAQSIRASGCGKRIQVTGYVSPESFRYYLEACDLAVQLRTQSRGETSAAVLDCLSYGIPVVVNAHGSMAELDGEAVWLLADEFDNASLVAALEALWRSPERRRRMGERGRDIVLRENSPEVCAQHYVDAIEHFHDQAKVSRRALIHAVAAQQAQPVAKPLSDGELMSLAAGIAASLPPPRPARRLFLDVTGTRRNELKTGIERVVRSLLLALMDAPPSGWRAEPVYLDHGQGTWHYRYARHYSLDLLGCPVEVLCDDERVEPECGDVLVVLDLSGNVLVQAVESGLLVHWRNVGVAVFSVVYDLLPVQMPQMFPPGADLTHSKWLHAISSFDGALAISRAVAADLASWQKSEGIDWTARRPFRIGSFRLGADVAGSASSRGLPADAAWMLQELRLRPSLLMVGTIEPRKGYMQVLEAFAELWGEGVDVNLVIVGREGWQGVPDSMRRGIPELIQRLRGHPERGRRLFWLESVSDEYLEQLYAAAHGLLAASYGEGFGLPLIEAAKHKLPVLARDLPVFREVAGEDAFYFRGWAARELADAVKVWLSTGARAPAAEGIRLTTWKQAADEFASIVTCPRAQARAESGTRMDSGE